jgi:hypothetical protein
MGVHPEDLAAGALALRSDALRNNQWRWYQIERSCKHIGIFVA